MASIQYCCERGKLWWNRTTPLVVPIARESVVFLASALAFWILLSTRTPAAIGLQLRYDSIFLPVGIGIFFYILYRLSSMHWALSGPLLLSAVLCAIVLCGVWNSYISDLYTLAGRYPHSDGRSYLDGSLNLLSGQTLSPFASRRPLAVLFWAFLLAVSGSNMLLGMALMVFICAMAIGWLSREIVSNYGWAAGYMTFMGLFLFYRRFIGTYLTEHLGLALGCLGMILLLRSIRGNRQIHVVSGMLMLTLALNARAGAFFILPALVIWAAFRWRGQAHFSFRLFLLTSSAVVLGFGLNILALRWVGQPAASQGNFPYVLYGLVHGGDWTQVRKDHPEVIPLPEVERHQAIFRLALDKIASEPISVLRGSVRAYKAFFFSTQGMYSFVFFSLQRSILKYPLDQRKFFSSDVSTIVHSLWEQPWKYLQIAVTFVFYGLFSILAVLGAVYLFSYHTATFPFLIASWGGILLSVPFVPPWDVDLMRIHAATIPFLVLLPALGFSWSILRGKTFKRPDSYGNWEDRGMEAVAFCTAVFTAILFLALPFFFAAKSLPTVSSPVNCYRGLPWVIRLVPGSSISITSEPTLLKQRNAASLPELHKYMGVLSVDNPHRTNAFLSFTSGQTLALGYDLHSKLMRYLVFEGTPADKHFENKWVPVCASLFYPDDRMSWWRIRDLPHDRP